MTLPSYAAQILGPRDPFYNPSFLLAFFYRRRRLTLSQDLERMYVYHGDSRENTATYPEICVEKSVVGWEAAFKAEENPINATKINRVEVSLLSFFPLCPVRFFWGFLKAQIGLPTHQKIDQPKEWERNETGSISYLGLVTKELRH